MSQDLNKVLIFILWVGTAIFANVALQLDYVLSLVNTPLIFCGSHVSLPNAYWRSQRMLFDGANQAKGYLSAFSYAFTSTHPSIHYS